MIPFLEAISEWITYFESWCWNAKMLITLFKQNIPEKQDMIFFNHSSANTLALLLELFLSPVLDLLFGFDFMQRSQDGCWLTLPQYQGIVTGWKSASPEIVSKIIVLCLHPTSQACVSTCYPRSCSSAVWPSPLCDAFGVCHQFTNVLLCIIYKLLNRNYVLTHLKNL